MIVTGELCLAFGEKPVKVGAPFNPYRVFQGAFAPFWLLEHRGLGAGAKLCYIRLLGFAGKDGRCYPSLETLGNALGVSDRQARDYVKELERAGIIITEQRGLRKTNVYLFVWTAELDRLVNSVPEPPDVSEDHEGPHCPSSADRNTSSAPGRNSTSAPDRNICSAQDRNTLSGPIGINSLGNGSAESSSSSAAEKVRAVESRKTMNSRARLASPAMQEEHCQASEIILRWASDRRVQRLRFDRTIGSPEGNLLTEWTKILDRMEIKGTEEIFALLDIARSSADRAGDWRNWSFLTLQIQLVAERMHIHRQLPTSACSQPRIEADEEDPSSEWAQVKMKIRKDVGEIPFTNWFERTRQTERYGSGITITVPDEPTRMYLESEYRELMENAIASLGLKSIRLIVREDGAYK